MLSQHDREVLSPLIDDYAALSSDPIQGQKRALWEAHNGLAPKRPMVMIDQVCWNELMDDPLLTCRAQDPFWRGVEWGLRQGLYQWRHLPVDRVYMPYLTLPLPIHNSGWGIERSLDTLRLDESSDVLSQQYHNQIHTLADVERLQTPILTLDAARRAEIAQEAEALLEGRLPYQFAGISMHLGLWDWISQWMGVEDCYIALMDEPELIHALMDKLTAGVLSMIAQGNAQGLFDVATHLCHCSHTFLKGLPGPDADPAHPKSSDTWAFGLAQLFTAVSPEVTEEFEIAYVKRMFPHFGALYYGCCERLEDRLHLMKQLPNVRKVSCSPWNDKRRFARELSDGLIMSQKPNPALVAMAAFDEGAVRADLRETIDAAREYGRPLEMILKDISTIKYKPARLHRWAEIAMEEVERG